MARLERRIEPERAANKHLGPIRLIRRNNWHSGNRLNHLAFAKQYDVHHQISRVTVFINRIVEIVGVIEIRACEKTPDTGSTDRFIRIDCSQNNS